MAFEACAPAQGMAGALGPGGVVNWRMNRAAEAPSSLTARAAEHGRLAEDSNEEAVGLRQVRRRTMVAMAPRPASPSNQPCGSGTALASTTLSSQVTSVEVVKSPRMRRAET